jgi:hypothetical protein
VCAGLLQLSACYKWPLLLYTAIFVALTAMCRRADSCLYATYLNLTTNEMRSFKTRDITKGTDSYLSAPRSHNIYDVYIYIHLFNRSWVDTRWQQYSTHLHTNNTQNNTKIIHILLWKHLYYNLSATFRVKSQYHIMLTFKPFITSFHKGKRNVVLVRIQHATGKSFDRANPLKFSCGFSRSYAE